MKRVGKATLVALMLGLAAAAAQAAQVSGSIASGRDGDNFAQDIGGYWNESSEFICSNQLSGSGVQLKVTARSGPCRGRFVTLTFDVNSGGTSTASHDFAYAISCTIGPKLKLTHALGFDGGGLQNIDSTTKVFNLTGLLQGGGGDVVTVTTTEGTLPVPGLTRGAALLLAAVLGLGLALLVRRQTRLRRSGEIQAANG